MFCQKCGAENKDGAAFCNDCGENLRLLPHTLSSPKKSITENEEFFQKKKLLEDKKRGHTGPIFLVIIGISLFFMGHFPLFFRLESVTGLSAIGRILMLGAVIWDLWRMNTNKNLDEEIESLRKYSGGDPYIRPSPSEMKAISFEHAALSQDTTAKSTPSANMYKIRNPLFAVVLSFFFIGWGQWYNGKTWEGVKFLGLSVIIYVVTIILATLESSIQFLALFFIMVLFIVLLAIWGYGMYDAYIIAKKINNGEEIFAGKSQLFWLPVIILTLAIFVILLAVVAAFIFGMAGTTS